ncbi:hypothetical protein EIN_172660 [Entamoeba invadens IP1]|uniref:Uncharacterized protein n=1 Tax=Entamoeba invadens IP1 TaxID=370355 RepID=A0A0A1TVZ2_ENTIV|nr:hypothetical protein EIN_172660 [Entamoeba invadens IP1]ELP84621.1 hypothetical protein EIN_172660 [Entamoeba invadens IP1]|eukprot:XP_004183967.1 hypothetical protein EIN_172660 [Entamoeba invadens IP1]
MESNENKQTASLKELKRCSKSFEAMQQAFVLALLNINGVGFKVKRPERRSQKTLQLFLIEELKTPMDGAIPFEKELDAFCSSFVVKELKESNYTHLTPSDVDSIASITRAAVDGISLERLKQIKRHRDANKTATSFNWIMERCEQLGYEFKKRSTKPAKYTKKMNKICAVGGKTTMTLVEISEIGKRINELVYQRFDKASAVVEVKGNDEDVSKIVKEVCDKLVNRGSVATDNNYIINDLSINENSNEHKSEVAAPALPVGVEMFQKVDDMKIEVISPHNELEKDQKGVKPTKNDQPFPSGDIGTLFPSGVYTDAFLTPKSSVPEQKEQNLVEQNVLHQCFTPNYVIVPQEDENNQISPANRLRNVCPTTNLLWREQTAVFHERQ